MTYELTKLPYAYDALEPYIDAQTMELHHSKHHAGYTTNFNNELSGCDCDCSCKTETLLQIFARISECSAAKRNNGGGYYNHDLFWKILSPKGGGQPNSDLLKAIEKSFGSFDDFKSQFSNAAATRFGSGWAWLVKQDDKLVVSSTPNQDNPLMDVADVKGTPILGLDVWEHAYYLKYQNRRPEYIAAFWNIVNWDEVTRRFLEA